MTHHHKTKYFCMGYHEDGTTCTLKKDKELSIVEKISSGHPDWETFSKQVKNYISIHKRDMIKISTKNSGRIVFIDPSVIE